MSNKQVTQSLRERTKSALERIASLENAYAQLISGVNESFGKVTQRVSLLEETLAAVVQSVGADQVQQIVEETRRIRAEEQAEQGKKEIATLVEKGILTEAEEVGEESFIVGHDVDDKGETIFPGFTHTHFKGVRPDLSEKVKGAKVGAKVLSAGENSLAGFVIDKIYTFHPEKAAKVQAAEAAAATPPTPLAETPSVPEAPVAETPVVPPEAA